MENTQKELILKFVFGDTQPTEKEINECLTTFNEFTEKLNLELSN